MMKWFTRKLKGFADVSGFSDPTTVLVIGVSFVFIILMLAYVLGTFDPRFAFWK